MVLSGTPPLRARVEPDSLSSHLLGRVDKTRCRHWFRSVSPPQSPANVGASNAPDMSAKAKRQAAARARRQAGTLVLMLTASSC
jgi:hypothetical protein